mmetsp:Transcript_23848/g.81298  ORF Transcript_23848/g.81298 Transcript_23848/m.81298 type:complete len:206 (+) Transcript_23848:168-785(+)
MFPSAETLSFVWMMPLTFAMPSTVRLPSVVRLTFTSALPSTLRSPSVLWSPWTSTSPSMSMSPTVVWLPSVDTLPTMLRWPPRLMSFDTSMLSPKLASPATWKPPATSPLPPTEKLPPIDTLPPKEASRCTPSPPVVAMAARCSLPSSAVRLLYTWIVPPVATFFATASPPLSTAEADLRSDDAAPSPLTYSVSPTVASIATERP